MKIKRDTRNFLRYLEAKRNWQATFEIPNAKRNKVWCLMRDIPTGFYWHIADCQGHALHDYDPSIFEAMLGTELKLRRGTIPANAIPELCPTVQFSDC